MRFVLAIALALCSLSALADILVVTLNGTPQDGGSLYGAQDSTVTTVADTFLNDAATTTNYGSSADWDTIDEFGQEQRAIITFDISSIPANSTITSAHLQAWQDSSGGSTDPLHCYGMQRSWVVGEATWNIYSTGNNWGTAGALNTSSDVDATSQDSNFNTGNGVWRAWDVTDWVQDVVDGARTNYGLLLGYPNRDDSSGWSNFVSSDGSDGSRPELWIEYTAAAGASIPVLHHQLRNQ